MFRLLFPDRRMLDPPDFERLAGLLRGGADPSRVREAVEEVRGRLNPHPAGQMSLNVPTLEGRRLTGIQHKYRETVLFFPSEGQTCHAYCTFCFRWPQFVGVSQLRFQSRQVEDLVGYLRAHPEVTDVLLTGGDPLVMSTARLREIVEPLLAPEFEHLQSLRIGTRALTFWPFRFLGDQDAEELLRLFEEVVAAGRHLSLMAHLNHPRELDMGPTRAALARVRATGAVVRCQSPLLRGINDTPEAWAELWRAEVRLGCVPYYMFVQRDTGARRWFEVPLARAWEIFTEAYSGVSGLARTVRGPSMSVLPGKVVVDGVAEVGGERVFVLHMTQARRPEWVNRPFFARFDADASWLDELRPALGEARFFFEA